ncbi:MAG: hypothetical protein FJ319_05615 [SAR202 cluster bacterium]|nr:hypothetical protein [SAR202 cluster bacterium]
MKSSVRAVEASGTVDQNGNLHLDEPITELGEGRVRVIVLPAGYEDISELEWLQAVTNNPAFEFLNDPEEDIYSLADGKLVSHEG